MCLENGLSVSVGGPSRKGAHVIEMDRIREMSRTISARFNPQRIVLFGSHATGTASAHSDVDLLVIMSFEGRPFLKSLEILNLVNPTFPIDLLAQKPEEVSRRYAEGDPLIREALDHGKVLYERDG